MPREVDKDELELEVVTWSAAAVLVRDDDDTEAWLPRSEVEFPERLLKGQVLTLEVPQWLIDKTGLK